MLNPKIWNYVEPTESIFDDSTPVIPYHLGIIPGQGPKFGDTVWDLNLLGRNPAVSTKRGIFDFSLREAKWALTEKTTLMILLNSNHKVLQQIGFFPKYSAGSVSTLNSYRHIFTLIIRWASIQRMTGDLSTWSSEDIELLIAWIEENYAVETKSRVCIVLNILKNLSPILPFPLLAEVPEAAKRKWKQEPLKTRPIEPGDFWSLLRACWLYISELSDDILDARDEFSSLRRFKKNPPKMSQEEAIQRLKDYLANDESFIPLHTKERIERFGEINWSGLAHRVGINKFHLVDSKSKIVPQNRELVFEAIKSGVPLRRGNFSRTPVSVTDSSGSSQPWCEGIDEQDNRTEVRRLHAACFIFISALSMMRVSETLAIECGSIGQQYGAPAIHSRIFKHRSFSGAEGFWWVSEPVVKAVQVAERIVDHTGQLFVVPRINGNVHGFAHYSAIRNFVNGIRENHSRLGLETINDTRIAAHRLRRTMSIVAGAQPNGEIALGISLKHNATRALANATTFGYASPTPSWERELHLSESRRAAAELVSDWANFRSGKNIASGPGAKTFEDKMSRVSSEISNRRIESERVLRDLLRDEFSEIQLGDFNHCLGDLRKAKCLENTSEDIKKLGPTLADCMRGTCHNSVITAKHISIWKSREKELRKLLTDKKLHSRHKKRMELELHEVSKITRIWEKKDTSGDDSNK